MNLFAVGDVVGEGFVAPNDEGSRYGVGRDGHHTQVVTALHHGFHFLVAHDHAGRGPRVGGHAVGGDDGNAQQVPYPAVARTRVDNMRYPFSALLTPLAVVATGSNGTTVQSQRQRAVMCDFALLASGHIY